MAGRRTIHKRLRDRNDGGDGHDEVDGIDEGESHDGGDGNENGDSGQSGHLVSRASRFFTLLYLPSSFASFVLCLCKYRR